MKFAYLIEPPFNFVDPNGRVTGCDVELARHIFCDLGVSEAEFIETEFAALIPGLSDGRWRMTTGLFGTDDRRRRALFSRPIWALSDGLLVARGNPYNLTGYTSVAENSHAKLAVIRDQVQHQSASEFGVSEDRITVFETYTEAAESLRDGRIDAYASVGRAHQGFIEQNPDWGLDLIAVPPKEKPPAFGSFAFRLEDRDLLHQVDDILARFLGTPAHRKLAAAFGFSDSEVDLVAD